MYEELLRVHREAVQPDAGPEVSLPQPVARQRVRAAQYAIQRREGFVVVTGDIGTGKTTLCRALLEQIDRTTFTALVLNPFLSEEDLLKRILQDFGVVSRDEHEGRAAGRRQQAGADRDALRFPARR